MPRAVFSAAKIQGMKAVKPSGFFLELADALEMIDAVLQGFAAAEHHGGGGAQAEGMRGAVDFHPVVTGAFEAGDLAADFVVENFRAAAGDGLQARVLETLNGVADGEFADFGDADNFRSGETVQVNLRVMGFERAKKIFVVADLQIGVQAALEEDAGAAQFEHLFNFCVDGFEGEDVAVFGAERAIEGAEGTIFGAEIGVVNVAVDLIGDDAGIVFLEAELMSGHADADEVVGLEHIEGLVFG